MAAQAKTLDVVTIPKYRQRYFVHDESRENDGVGRIAQRESTSLTSKGSLVQSQLRPPSFTLIGEVKSWNARPWLPARRTRKDDAMKVKNSLRSLKNRHRDCRVVRRKGRIYVINKTQRRFKARQG